MSDNPYSSPTADAAIGMAERQDFLDLPTPQLKRLFFASSTIHTLAVLFFIGIFRNLKAVVDLYPVLPGLAILQAAVMVLVVVTGVTAFLRTHGAQRTLGIVTCLLLMVYQSVILLWFWQALSDVELGAAVAGLVIVLAVCIMGLIAYLRAAPLFGADRLSSKALKAEYRHRKKHKVA